MRLNTRILISSVASVFMAITLFYMGANFLLNSALKRDARLAGMDWAVLMEDRLADIVALEPLLSNSASTALPTTQDLRQLAVDIFAIGHMYQIDYINVACHCHVSLNLHDTHDNLRTDAHAGHDHSDGSEHNPNEEKLSLDDVNSVPNQIWKHVYQNTKLHANPGSNETGPHNFPVDRSLVQGIMQRKSEVITIHHDVSPDLPATFAEVFYPATNGKDVLYLLRVIVDLEDQARFYQRFMLIAVASSALILAIAMGYPTWYYLDAVRKKRTADKRVEFLANHDVLTNLFNRNNFHETASDIFWTCRENGQSALLFVFDLNGFKEINDYHGHPVGDKLLCEFASQLRQHAPSDAYIARLGGDEFVVVISGIEHKDFDFGDFLRIPDSINVKINASNQVASASVAGGVVQYPRDAKTTEELLQLADLALYAAKSDRSAQIHEYTPEMKDSFFDRLKIRDEFRNALNNSEIEPYYQPIINIRTGLVESFEALARWNHPERGILTPLVFSEVLKDGEICASLGHVMFEKILDDMSYWQSTSVPFKKIGINVTDGDLRPPSFATDMLRGLAERRLQADGLTIEVTENCLFGPEKANSLEHLQRLRDAGCSIALDDFGTGYSSITQLKALPISRIKIDKSFIDNVLESEDDQSIIAAMLDLGALMDFDLVMEGIETAQQLSLLTRMGSELVQGYYFSRPLPAAEVPAFIARQNSKYEYERLQSKAI